MEEIIKIKEKVNNLEDIMARLAYEQMNTQISLQQLSKEMKEFKQEMKEFKDEMKEFKDEMREFKNNSEIERKRVDEEIKRINRQWAELANKMGTFAEDIVAPNVPFIAETYFGLKDYNIFIVRIKKINPFDRSKQKEFDTIAIYDTKIILTEVKSTARISYANEFIDFIKNNEFYEYFPEYKDKELIPVFASLYIDDNIVRHLTKNNILCLAMKGGTMDLLNPEIINIK